MPRHFQHRGIALYDMDGTLFAWDCQLLFRNHVIRAEQWRFFSVLVFIGFLPFAKLLGMDNMKRIFHCFLWRISAERLREYSVSFAKSLKSTVYPELLVSITRHKAAGDFLILSSASPECYVQEVGKILGFDVSLGTVLQSHRFFPDLINHKGERKVIRLREILPCEAFLGKKLIKSHGYSDSIADLPMLTLCERATVINPNSSLNMIAKEEGWDVLRPATPWKSSFEKVLRVAALVLALGKNPAKL